MFKAYERLQQLTGKPYLSNSLPSISFANGAMLPTVCRSRSAGPQPRGAITASFALNDMGITPDYLRREIVAKDPKNNESREYRRNRDAVVWPDEEALHANRVFARRSIAN